MFFHSHSLIRPSISLSSFFLAYVMIKTNHQRLNNPGFRSRLSVSPWESYSSLGIGLPSIKVEILVPFISD